MKNFFIAAESTDVLDQGFHVAKKSKLQVSFDLSIIAENTVNIDKSELWLFPYQSKEDANQDTVGLTFHVTAQALTSTKKSAVTYTWNTQDSCISLDVTTAMKRLLKTKSEGLTEIILTIETTQMKVLEQKGQIDQEFEKFCISMESRGCNTPFLVFKYFTEEATPTIPALLDLVDIHPRLEEGEESPKKRAVVDGNETVISANETQENIQCSLRDAYINFSEVLNSNTFQVLEPKVVNIGVCGGGCPSREKSYTPRSQLIKLLGLQQRSCCLPSTFSAFLVLINANGIYSIQQLNDLVVTDCLCPTF